MSVPLQQAAVLTLHGVCGKTVRQTVLGLAVDVSCDVDDAAVMVDIVDPPPDPLPGKSSVTTRPSDIFDSGHPGSAAEFAIRDTLDRLVRENRANDHLIVITPDGRAGHDPDAYRRMLDSYQQPAGEGPLELQIDERLHASLLRRVNEQATPYVIVCARGVTRVGPEQLEGPLRAAAEAQAPIQLLSF
jgi:hypothetical protein